jgi:hypothetical protein
MPCTPAGCDIHDYPVAPGGGWCLAVDAAHFAKLNMPRSNSHDEDLAGAILRLSDILERMEARQPKWSPPQPAPEQRRQSKNRTGGTPL